MPYEQPADTISAGDLSAEKAAELFAPIRKDVHGGKARGDDTSEDSEPQGDDSEESGEDTRDEEEESPDEVEGDSEQVDDEESSEEEEEEALEEVEEDPKRRHTVKVDGKEERVTLEELKKGFSFNAHNTRRAQELSEKEKAVVAKESEAATLAKTYAEHLAEVKDALQKLTPAEPDWDKLRKENPAKFAEMWAAWDQHKKGLAKLDDEHKAARAKVQEEENRRMAEHLSAENDKLTAAVPAWSDQKVRTRDMQGMAEYAKSRGFSDDELNSVFDHRTVLLLRDAYQHSIAKKNAAAVKGRVDEVKSLTPGSSASQPGRATVAKQAMARLEKSGSVDDAVAALEQCARRVGDHADRSAQQT